MATINAAALTALINAMRNLGKTDAEIDAQITALLAEQNRNR